ncbi:unnamed protein product, partial [Iphiclides podalirius]
MIFSVYPRRSGHVATRVSSATFCNGATIGCHIALDREIFDAAHILARQAIPHLYGNVVHCDRAALTRDSAPERVPAMRWNDLYLFIAAIDRCVRSAAADFDCDACPHDDCAESPGSAL